MKRTLFVLAGAAVLAVGSYVVYAAQTGGMMGGGMMNENQKTQPPMAPNDRMGGMRGRGMMADAMDSVMWNSSLTTNEDGGVIVLMGNQLFKYDRNLNLEKQVEVKVDWEKVMLERHQMMRQYNEMIMREQTGQQ